MRYSQREKCQSLKSTVKPTWNEKMSVLSTFLEYSLNFLSNKLKKTVQNSVQSRRKVVSKFEMSEFHFEITVKDKIACKTYLK